MGQSFTPSGVTRLRRSLFAVVFAIMGIVMSTVVLALVVIGGGRHGSPITVLPGLFLMGMTGLLRNSWIAYPQATQVRANRRGLWIDDEFLSPSQIIDVILLERSMGAVIRVVRRGALLPIDLVMKDKEQGRRLLRALSQEAQSTLEIGADGLLARSTAGERYINYAEIEAVSLGESPRAPQVELVLRSGEVVLVALPGPRSGDRVASAVRQITTALQAFARAEIADEPRILTRGDRPLDAWVAQLRSFGVGADAAHRVAPLLPDTLFRILESPYIRPTLRAAAAVALGSTLDPRDRARVKVALATTTAPKLRIAIKAAAGSATDAELAAILAEVEVEDALGIKGSRGRPG